MKPGLQKASLRMRRRISSGICSTNAAATTRAEFGVNTGQLSARAYDSKYPHDLHR